jgi:hypothetical protein
MDILIHERRLILVFFRCKEPALSFFKIRAAPRVPSQK